MNIKELEQVTRDYLTDIYKRKYIDKIKVIPLETKGYSVHIGRGVQYQDFVICAELDDDKFLPFLKKELRRLDFYHTSYGDITLRNTSLNCPKNTSCCDKG